MTRTTIVLDEERKIKLGRQAKLEHATMSEIIRKALDSYIGEPESRKLSFQGVGESSHKAISEKEEELLFKKTR